MIKRNASSVKTGSGVPLRGTWKAVAVLAVLAFAACVNAADLTVAQGDDPVTIDANSTYDAVVVNGELTVAPGVTLTCTSLTVADNISGTAKLMVGDGATVTVTGTDDNTTKIGVGSGRAEVYLGTGAKFTATKSGYFNFCYGYDSAPDASVTAMTESLLVVGTNATLTCRRFCFGHDDNNYTNKPSSIVESYPPDQRGSPSGRRGRNIRISHRGPVAGCQTSAVQRRQNRAKNEQRHHRRFHSHAVCREEIAAEP